MIDFHHGVKYSLRLRPVSIQAERSRDYKIKQIYLQFKPHMMAYFATRFYWLIQHTSKVSTSARANKETIPSGYCVLFNILYFSFVSISYQPTETKIELTKLKQTNYNFKQLSLFHFKHKLTKIIRLVASLLIPRVCVALFIRNLLDIVRQVRTLMR